MSFPVKSLKKAGYNLVQTPTMSPQVRNLWEQLSGKVSGPALGGVDLLSRIAGGDQSQFEQMEAPAMRQFQGLMGNISSRFSGQGGLGARHSSGFQHETTSAAQDLAERLQSQRMGFQQDAVKQLLGIYGDLMGKDPYEYSMVPRKKPFWQELSLGLAGGLGGAAGSALGSWAGSKF